MLTAATPSTSGFLYYSGVPAAPTVVGAGCVVQVDPATYSSLLPLGAGPSGSWATTVGAVDQGLAGLQAVMQIALFGTAAPLGIDISNGTIVTVGY